MSTRNFLTRGGSAAVVLLAGVLVLATGCAQQRVVHVRPAYPVAAPPPPVAVATVPADVVALPATPPPAPAVPLRSAADLDNMLAPIALYPDPLLAQILPAATSPEQVVMVHRFLREGGTLHQVDAQPWDNSLKALARYPATLEMLDEHLAWTTELGRAFLHQPRDVMDSVQRLRAQALALGNLQSTPQQTVMISEGIIEIVPATPQWIHVPVYQPEVVYVQPPPPPGRVHITFGVRLLVGAWLNHDCDWHRREVIVWHHDHPRPADWWYRPASRRDIAPAVHPPHGTAAHPTPSHSQNVSVWRPRTRDAVMNRGDRGWERPDARATPAPARYEGVKPEPGGTRQTPSSAQAQKPVPAREAPTTTMTRDARPSRPQPQPSPPQPQATPRHTGTVEPVAPSKSSPTAGQPGSHPPLPARAAAPNPQPQQPLSAPQTTRSAPAAAAKPSSAAPTRTPRPAGPPPPSRTAPPAARPAARPAAPPAASRAASPASSHAAAPAASRPVVSPALRPSSGALKGIDDSRSTRAASARGQQSRQAISKPVARPARSTPAPLPAPSSPPKSSSGRTTKPQQPRGK
ncbi:MAG: DUF3300 domain-containing protein [Verrucomicrobia bacterium]|nr:DUF3300 domain-containing protein [Verrucomicrobiota bacterium]